MVVGLKLKVNNKEIKKLLVQSGRFCACDNSQSNTSARRRAGDEKPVLASNERSRPSANMHSSNMVRET